MRLDEEKGTSNLETKFIASNQTNKDKQPSIEITCTCKCEEKGDDEEGLSDEEYAYFTRKIKIGKGKFKGKLPLICFGYGEVGHFASKFPKRMVYLCSMKIIMHSGKEEWRSISWRKVTKYEKLLKMDLHQPQMNKVRRIW